jgi:Tfp pilus assembly protein FimV
MKCSMKRALTLVSGVGASLYPIFSCALGLGELQVDSRLNQPLRAHIEVSDVSEEEWRQIHARLAQQGEGAALLRTTLDSIVLRATEDASHRHFVEVSSNDPITEPLFDLSVEVAGQTVQVIRNYSVFLDPPGRDEAGSRAVVVAGNAGRQGAESPGVAAGRSTAGGDAARAVGSSGAASARGEVGSAGGATAAGRARARGANGSVGAAGAAHAAGGVSTGGAVTRVAGGGGAVGAGANQQVGLQAGAVYTVVQSDTLERIVRRLGARTAAAKNQQMQWVFEHNPGAFYGSMDRLRAGVQLTLPGEVAVATVASGPVAPAVPKGTEVQPTQVAAAGQKATAPDDRVVQTQLEGQVTTLQQTLAKMQETIAAQDAQIADLNRKIAARVEQRRAERATDALAARIAPEIASATDDSAQRSGAARSDAIGAEAEESAGRPHAAAANSGDDTTVAERTPRWWAKRATYYWAGALGAAAILVALLVTAIRRRREAEEAQYAPRYPLAEDSRFRYEATLESPPPVKQAPPRQPEPEVRQPSSGLQVEEAGESGLESWSTQTALLLSDLPAPDDTQPFMMAPHDDVETEFENKRRSLASSAEEPTAKLQAMETHTVDLQTTGELMTPEELAEAELLGMADQDEPADGQHEESRWPPGVSSRVGQDERHQVASEQGENRRAANESDPFGQAERRAGQGGRAESSWALGEPSPFGRSESRAGSSGPGRGGQGESHRGAGAGRTDAEDAGTVEIGSEELLAAETLVAPTNPDAARAARMDLARLREAQMSTTEIQAAELRRDRTAASKEVAEILEASLNYEPDRVDIKLKLLEIYHHEALGNRENFRSLLSKLAKDSRLLSPAQRQHVETLQRTLNDGKQDVDSSFVAEVAI